MHCSPLCIQYFLRIYYAPGTLGDTWDSSVNKSKTPAHLGLLVSEKKVPSNHSQLPLIGQNGLGDLELSYPAPYNLRQLSQVIMRRLVLQLEP